MRVGSISKGMDRASNDVVYATNNAAEYYLDLKLYIDWSGAQHDLWMECNLHHGAPPPESKINSRKSESKSRANSLKT